MKKERTKETLAEVGIKLKEKFVGIDEVIDRLIDEVTLWYLMPELQLRPTIISLWGITGVGKTDLIRTFVKLIGMQSSFLEMQMESGTGNQLIEDAIETAGITTNKPSILLLDEIQRFRAVDEEGKGTTGTKLQDVWALLSDGKFASNSNKMLRLIEFFYESLYSEDANRSNRDFEKIDQKRRGGAPDPDDEEYTDEEYNSAKMVYNMGVWSANKFKRLLNLEDMSLEEAMKLSNEEKIKMLREAVAKDEVSDGAEFTKMLIFVSGNLDEAFYMAGDVADVDLDADVYHEMSKDIGILDIKAALTKRFKPEQIARFGNNHIIYPILNRAGYEKIIRTYSDKIIDVIKQKSKINLTIDQSVYDAIYRNSVFPTQGVRPTISTVNSLLGSNAPHFLFEALERGITDITLVIEDFTLSSPQLEITKEVVLDIDALKDDQLEGERYLVAVHELGHALQNTIEFGVVPDQINVNAVSNSAGFVITSDSLDTKENLLKGIRVSLAGRAAEQLVFGNNKVSSGAASDISKATRVAGGIVRRWGMQGNIGRISPTDYCSEETMGILDVKGDSDNSIHRILQNEYNNTVTALKTRLHILRALLSTCIDADMVMLPETFQEICAEFDLKSQLYDEDFDFTQDHAKLAKDFLAKK